MKYRLLKIEEEWVLGWETDNGNHDWETFDDYFDNDQIDAFGQWVEPVEELKEGYYWVNFQDEEYIAAYDGQGFKFPGVMSYFRCDDEIKIIEFVSSLKRETTEN